MFDSEDILELMLQEINRTFEKEGVAFEITQCEYNGDTADL